MYTSNFVSNNINNPDYNFPLTNNSSAYIDWGEDMGEITLIF